MKEPGFILPEVFEIDLQCPGVVKRNVGEVQLSGMQRFGEVTVCGRTEPEVEGGQVSGGVLGVQPGNMFVEKFSNLAMHIHSD